MDTADASDGEDGRGKPVDGEPGRWVVLCVEDDGILRTLIDLALRLDPLVSVKLAASSEDAKALWLSGFRPDLVLLDFRLPGMGGVDLLRWLKDVGGMISPAVFLTATTHHADHAEMMRAGGAGIIRKPFHPLDLATQVRAFLPDSLAGQANVAG